MIGAIFLVAAQAGAVAAPPPRPALNADFTCRVFPESGTPERITGFVRQTSDENRYLITEIQIVSQSSTMPSASDRYAAIKQLSELPVVEDVDTSRYSWMLRTPSIRHASSTTIVLAKHDKFSSESRYIATGLCDLTSVEPTA